MAELVEFSGMELVKFARTGQPGEQREAERGRDEQPRRPPLPQPQVRQVATQDLGHGCDQVQEEGLHEFQGSP